MEKCLICGTLMRVELEGLPRLTALCDETCMKIWDAITPGEWIDAAEMMEGGSLHHRLPYVFPAG